ncbi:unnamed protein product [Ectocarpus sp. CCAP 1310/34]|nr:unnamed protein product [Ectocarpus sp. CCAP 1310/34]
MSDKGGRDIRESIPGRDLAPDGRV